MNVADGSVAWTVHCPQLPWFVAASANYLITVEAAYEETSAMLCGYPLSGAGHQLWSVGLSAWPFVGEPVCVGDTVLVPTSDTVTAYDGATGASLWTSDIAQSTGVLTVPVTVVGDAMFSSSGTELIGLRVSDGSQVMSLDIGAPITAIVTSA